MNITRSTLGQISKVLKTGKTPPSKNKAYFTKDYNWYTPSDIGDKKFINSSIRHISNLALKDKKAFLYPENSLLITCIGNIGRVGISNKECASNQQITAINPKKDIDVEYLYYWFIAHQNLINSRANIAVVAILNNKSLSEIPFNYPPLKTQQHIAQILDDAAALRDKTKQLLTEYDLLAQSIFLEMFGDPGINNKGFKIRQLDEFYVSKKEGTKCGPFGGALKKEEYVEEGIAVWNMDNISKNGELNTDIKLWITEDKFVKLESYNVKNDDIIISRAGTVGKMGVVKSEFDRSIISTNLIRLRLDSSKLLPLFFTMMMNYFKDRVGRLKTGAEGSFTHMNTGVLNSLKFPYPSIHLQTQFAEKIALIEQQKALAKQELQESEDLFNCLLQKAFKGELVLETA